MLLPGVPIGHARDVVTDHAVDAFGNDSVAVSRRQQRRIGEVETKHLTDDLPGLVAVAGGGGVLVHALVEEVLERAQQ